jgi:hypothetical protein
MFSSLKLSLLILIATGLACVWVLQLFPMIRCNSSIILEPTDVQEVFEEATTNIEEAPGE